MKPTCVVSKVSAIIFLLRKPNSVHKGRDYDLVYKELTEFNRRLAKCERLERSVGALNPCDKIGYKGDPKLIPLSII